MKLTCKYSPAKLRVHTEVIIEEMEEALSEMEGRPLVLVAYEGEGDDGPERHRSDHPLPETRLNLFSVWVPAHGVCPELEISYPIDGLRERRAITFTDTAEAREVAMSIMHRCEEIDRQNIAAQLGVSRR